MWRYVEVTAKDSAGNKFASRFFYVKDIGIQLGMKVKKGDAIGVAQGIEVLYEGITEHIHYEVKVSRATYVNPMEYLRELETV
jgi:murein DD-endopeptidase MepM/ murein hydrolase activator NlpD